MIACSVASWIVVVVTFEPALLPTIGPVVLVVALLVWESFHLWRVHAPHSYRSTHNDVRVSRTLAVLSVAALFVPFTVVFCVVDLLGGQEKAEPHAHP